MNLSNITLMGKTSLKRLITPTIALCPNSFSIRIPYLTALQLSIMIITIYRNGNGLHLITSILFAVHIIMITGNSIHLKAELLLNVLEKTKIETATI